MICRITLEAYRIRQWPVEGSNLYDLEVAVQDARDYLSEGFSHFSHDDDIPLRDFILWGSSILKGVNSENLA